MSFSVLQSTIMLLYSEKFSNLNSASSSTSATTVGSTNSAVNSNQQLVANTKNETSEKSKLLVGSEDGDAGGIGEVDLGKRDKMFEEAARLIVQYQQGSTSLIQRRMNLGYNRAGRIMDQLEAAGIVGPSEGSKARQVLVTDFNTLDRILASLN